MNECKHKWIFQDTEKTVNVEKDKWGDYIAYFYRWDIYYCENCCEIKEIERKERVDLPFGGIHHVDSFAPVWY